MLWLRTAVCSSSVILFREGEHTAIHSYSILASVRGQNAVRTVLRYGKLEPEDVLTCRGK